ncbi:transaldolase family protein [Pseudothermotoga sp.]|nr:hypothetical protein [Pseudothermotoga sp.]MCX7813482.1 hypothetical protein [Pseudothermotoga sp.]MDW8139530.1 transaldolase family protein [Pseudothermotoga sp.]
MKLYIDGCSETAIKIAEDFNLGITTNPTIILRDRPGETIEEVIERLKLAKVPEIFVHLETFDESILSLIDPNKFVIKLPWIRNKYDLALTFKKAGFRVCATAVYTPQQIVSAVLFGVNYVAFYFDRSSKKGFDPREKLSCFISMINKTEGELTVIVASLKTIEQVIEAINVGATHLTVPVELFERLLQEDEMALNDAFEFSRDFAKLVRNFP